MEMQTIRNVFEAFLQTSYLSPDQVVEILRVRGETGKLLANHFREIRDEFLEAYQMNGIGEEPDVEEYIDRLVWYIN